MKILLKVFGYILAGLISLVAIIFLIGFLQPEAHTATVSKEIPTSKEIVWEYITNPAEFTEWRSDVSKVVLKSDSSDALVWTEYYTYGDVLPFKEISRTDSSIFISEIIDEGLPFGGTWTITLTESKNSTVISITENGKVYNPVYRFFSKFVFGHETSMKTYLADLEQALQ